MGTKRKTREIAKAIETADVAVAKAFVPVHDAPVVKAVGAASEVGDQPPLYALSAGVLAAGVLTGDRQTARAGLRMLAAHFLAIRLKNLAKHLVDRNRPKVAAKNGRYILKKGERFDSDYNSFPSGHTASSLAVAKALGGDYPGLHGGAVALAGTIAAVQVVRGKHFALDLAGGAVLGLVAEAAANRWVDKMAQP